MGLAERFAREDAEATAAASFDEFWRLYPRKVAKLEAMKAWKQMTREFSADEIIAGLRANLNALLRREKQFIKHPASWLRAGCWMDEPETPHRPGITGAAQRMIEVSHARQDQSRDCGLFQRLPAITSH